MYDNNRNKKIIRYAIIASLVLVVLLVTYYLFLRPKSAEQVATNFISLVVSKNNAKDSYSLTSPDFKSNTSLSAWTTNVESTNTFCSGTISKATGSFSKNTAAYNFVEKSNSNICNSSVSLSKINGRWYVDYFSPL